MSSIKGDKSSQSQKPKDGKSFNKTPLNIPKWASFVQENISFVGKIKHFPNEMIGVNFFYAESNDQVDIRKGYKLMTGKFVCITEEQLKRILEAVNSRRSGLEDFIPRHDPKRTTGNQNDADNDNDN